MIHNNTNNETINQVPIEDEWPVATLIAVWFIAAYIVLLIAAKTVFEWSETMKESVNRFDLAIYKPPEPVKNNNNNNSNNQNNRGERRLFDNSVVRQHNLKAFNSSGINLETLVPKTSLARATTTMRFT